LLGAVPIAIFGLLFTLSFLLGGWARDKSNEGIVDLCMILGLAAVVLAFWSIITVNKQGGR